MVHWKKEIYLAVVTYSNKSFPNYILSTLNKIFYRDNIYAIKKQIPLIEKDVILILYKSFSWRQVEERLRIVKTKLHIDERHKFTVDAIDHTNAFVHSKTFTNYIQALRYVVEKRKLLNRNSDKYIVHFGKGFVLENIVCDIRFEIYYEKIELF